MERRGDTENPVSTRSQPNLPSSPSPIYDIITRLVTTMKRWGFSIYPNSIPHLRERGGYLLRHVPYFIHCPVPHCPWRGKRADLFNRHWQQEDHRGYHVYYGRTPKRSQIETYNPWIILNPIKDGVISIREGGILANCLVLWKSFALQKTNVWRMREAASKL